MSSMMSVTTTRGNGMKQAFHLEPLLEENCLHSTESIPEPHSFTAEVQLNNHFTNKIEKFKVEFKEPEDDEHDVHNHSSHQHNALSLLDDDHGHGHGHGHDHGTHDETRRIKVTCLILSFLTFSPYFLCFRREMEP
jgi:hypothetical protein